MVQPAFDPWWQPQQVELANADDRLASYPPAPPPMMTANPQLSELPSLSPQPLARPLPPQPVPANYFAPWQGPAPEVEPLPPAPVWEQAPVTFAPEPKQEKSQPAPASGGVGALNKEIAASQADYLEKQSQRAAVAQQQAEDAEAYGRSVGIQAAATNAELARQAADMDALNVRAEAETGKALNDYRTEAKRVSSMSVDPTRVLPKGVFATILGTIGAALGGAGQALTGRNSFMETVNGAIDRDIDAQKANIANAREGVAQKGQLYGLMRQKFGDERQAKLATRDTYLLSVDRWLGGLEAKAKTEQAKNQFRDLRIQVEQERDKDAITFAKEKKHEIVSAAAAQNAALWKAQERIDKLSGEAQDRELKREELDVKRGDGQGGQKDLMGRYSAAAGGVLQRPEQAQKFDEQAKAFDFAAKELKSIQDDAKKIGLADKLKPWDSNRVTDVRARANALIPVITQAFGAGTPGEAEGKRALESMLGDPASLTGPDSVERISTFMGTLERGKNAMSSSLGVVPAKKVVENGKERIVLTGEQAKKSTSSSSHGFKADAK